MARTNLSPLGGVVGGAVAGAVGTLAMDLVWYRRYLRGGGAGRFTDWEFSSGVDSYEQAAAPAQVGRRLIEGLFDMQLKPHTAGFTNNVVHWMTGVGWGALHGLVVGAPGVRPRHRARVPCVGGARCRRVTRGSSAGPTIGRRCSPVPTRTGTSPSRSPCRRS